MKGLNVNLNLMLTKKISIIFLRSGNVHFLLHQYIYIYFAGLRQVHLLLGSLPLTLVKQIVCKNHSKTSFHPNNIRSIYICMYIYSNNNRASEVYSTTSFQVLTWILLWLTEKMVIVDIIRNFYKFRKTSTTTTTTTTTTT